MVPTLSTEYTDATSSTDSIKTTESTVTSQPTDGTSTSDLSGTTEVTTGKTDGTSTTDETGMTQVTSGSTEGTDTTDKSGTTEVTSGPSEGTYTTDKSGTTEVTSGPTEFTYTTDKTEVTTVQTDGTSTTDQTYATAAVLTTASSNPPASSGQTGTTVSILSTAFTDATSSTDYISTTESTVTSQPTDSISTSHLSGTTQLTTGQSDSTSDESGTTEVSNGSTESPYTTDQSVQSEVTTLQTDCTSTTDQTYTTHRLSTAESSDASSTTDQTDPTAAILSTASSNPPATSGQNGTTVSVLSTVFPNATFVSTTELTTSSNPTDGTSTSYLSSTTVVTTGQSHATPLPDQTGTTQLTSEQTGGTYSTPQSGSTVVTPVQPNTPSSNPTSQPPTTVTTKPPTTPSPQPSSGPTISTREPLQCQNGGTYNGYNCTCPTGLIGTVCQFVEVDVEPVTFIRTVVVNLVIDQEYNVKYDDKTSREYKEFVGNFTNQMEKYYLAKKIANFKEVVVISVSRGAPLVRFLRNPVDERQLWDKAMAFHSITPRTESVNVTHDVVLGIPNNASAEQLYWEDVEAVVKAVEGLDSCTGECPDFNTTTPPTVTTTEADLGSVCEQFVKDPEVAKYYQLVPIDGKLTCVTVCHNQHSHHKRCYNRGICLVYKTIGPLCECLNVEETWYLNDDCSLPIHRTPFYAGISVTLACLLLIVGVLTAFLLRNKHRQSKRRRDIQEQLVNQWLNEDFEWSRSNSDIDSTGDFNNLAYAHEEAAVHREELEGYRQPAPVDILTGHLDTDDRQLSSSANIHGLDTEYHLPVTPGQHNTLTTNTLSFSTVEHPQSDSLSPPLRDLSRISRPQIRISWDP